MRFVYGIQQGKACRGQALICYYSWDTGFWLITVLTHINMACKILKYID